MIRNYLKIALRNILRQKVYSIINLVGLTIGIAAFLIITLYIQHEIGYDAHIVDSDRMYRCVELQKSEGVGEQHVAVTMAPLKEAIVRDFPEVEKATRLMHWGRMPIVYDGQQYNQDLIVFTDPETIEFFGIKFLKGDTATAMKDPHSIIMSEKNAVKYFGSVDEAMDKVISLYNYGNFKVSGVIEDQPENSHFRMEMLVPFQFMLEQYKWLDGWGSNAMTTYIRLSENADIPKLEAKFHDWLVGLVDPDDPDKMFDLYLQAVPDIHLKSNYIKFQTNFNPGNITMVYVFTIIALLIIIVASINYINMAIARSFKRAREVGMRKVLGATRSSLMYQFIGESFILTFFAIILSVMLVQILLPVFNQILGINLSISFISNPLFNIGLIVILIVVSLVSGSYPSFYLSRFKPISTLKGSLDKKSGGTGNLSKVLVVVQFIIAIGLIFSVMVTWSQYQYALNKDLGYNIKDVIEVRLYNRNSRQEVQAFKNELSKNPNIMQMSQTADINGVSGSQNTLYVDDSAKTKITCRIGLVDPEYFDMMEIPIIQGRSFSDDFSTDTVSAVILNEAALEYLKWDNPLDMSFKPFWTDTIYKKRVIGVISDYHYYSLNSKIEPAAYIYSMDIAQTLAVKINPVNRKETIKFIEEKWTELFQGAPFEYSYATEILKENYEDEANSMNLFFYFAILSIIISALGLYGLTSFLIEQRKKEIGIRKTFGASVSQITLKLISGFVVLVVIAGVIASAVSWYFMDKALDNFVYRISIEWYYFVIAILVAVFIALVTIIYHATRSALANPVDALRYE